ncbi:MAG: DUF3482 domain-containing protein [Polaromonas sp.]
MSQAPKHITLDEPLARRIVLMRAIEAGDTQGKLLSAVERDDIDRLAAQAVGPPSPLAPDGASAQALLQGRAQQVMRVVENRNPALAALQQRRAWTRWLAGLGFVAAVVFGAATDRVANPHRVDLLSLPLLAIVAWNLTVYAFLIVSHFLPSLHRLPRLPHLPRWLTARQPQPAGESAPGAFMRWASGLRGWQQRAGQLRASITTLFLRQWYGSSAALQAQRWRKVLHLAAAGWAFGIGLSLFTRGLVVEYRIGWESTFLNAEQVHALLHVLLLPAAALLPFAPFTVQDIASLQFGQGSQAAGTTAGARWVYLYATLLALLVIAPRLALAAHAAWRERTLSQRIVLNLATPYYQRLLALLNPTRIQIGLLALRPGDRDALLRVVRPRGLAPEPTDGAHGPALLLSRARSGETLYIAAVAWSATAPPEAAPQPAAAKAPAPSLEPVPGWSSRAMELVRGMRRTSSNPSPTTDAPPVQAGPVPNPAPTPAHASLQPALDDSDMLLLTVQDEDDLAAALPWLRGAGKPALVVVTSPAALTPCRNRARSAGLSLEMLDFDSFVPCWVQDPVLLDALGRCMPAAKKPGFDRLAEVWRQRNEALFAQSMQLIATQLLHAARETQEVGSDLSYVKWLISSADRQSHAQALKDAMAAVAKRLQHSLQQTQSALLRLHGLDEAQGALLEPALQQSFDIHAPVNARQAGFAGAATGAASGASIDLLTGGLTLGAAAALGALIGGGAAYAGAAWKNRATPAGTTLVQLSDDMLHAMTAAALLRYLALARFARIASVSPSSETAALWESQVLAALEARKEKLLAQWTQARKPKAPITPPADAAPDALATLDELLQQAMRQVLAALYSGNPR